LKWERKKRRMFGWKKMNSRAGGARRGRRKRRDGPNEESTPLHTPSYPPWRIFEIKLF